MKFTDINFGLAEAESEKVRNPELLLEGFFDENGYLNEVREGYRFLVLGPKGSGKSAIGSKLELDAKNGGHYFVKSYHLGSFPHSKFGEIFPKKTPPK